MILIIGLGNPGKKYQNTRHNVGFRAIDEIAANFQLSIFNFQSIFNAKISKGKIADKKVILAKPQTFMNLSGKAVLEIVNFYKINPANILVVHDDIDLPLNRIRIVQNRGSAGHKGIQSIINCLKTKNFIRLRIGVSPLTGKPNDPERFVLQKLNQEEEKIIKEATKKIAEAVECFLKAGLEKTASFFNK